MITSLFTGMYNAVRGLQHAQTAVTVHGSNIAHANDTAYTRRQVLTPTEAGITGPGIARIRDLFIDQQYRSVSASLGEAEARQDVLSKVEDILGDPVAGGLRKALDEFFDAWQALADDPTSGVARLQVLSAGRQFVNEIRTAYRGFAELQETVNDDLVDNMREVNNLLNQVFELNKRISYLTRNQMNDADLRDLRDLALDKLAKLVGATATEGEDGVVRITVGSTSVLYGPTVLTLVMGATGQPVWQSADGTQHPYTGGGVIAGLVSVRDEELQTLKQEIALLARQVAEAVNRLHSDPPFFVDTDNPWKLAVNPDLTPDKIMTGPSGLPSDGEIARQIAALATEGIDGWDSSSIVTQALMTPGTFYQNLVGWVGIKAADANLSYEVARTHLAAEEEQRQASWGVSLDEEVAGMMMQQKAYAACARLITVMDEMLQTLIDAIR
ncbi:MAG TPA: flagellar hook-associated protein FlgK [Symbiobacteriaceae bacterium]